MKSNVHLGRIWTHNVQTEEIHFTRCGNVYLLFYFLAWVNVQVIRKLRHRCDIHNIDSSTELVIHEKQNRPRPNWTSKYKYKRNSASLFPRRANISFVSTSCYESNIWKWLHVTHRERFVPKFSTFMHIIYFHKTKYLNSYLNVGMAARWQQMCLAVFHWLQHFSDSVLHLIIPGSMKYGPAEYCNYRVAPPIKYWM